jgi:hypothetical protein
MWCLRLLAMLTVLLIGAFLKTFDAMDTLLWYFNFTQGSASSKPVSIFELLFASLNNFEHLKAYLSFFEFLWARFPVQTFVLKEIQRILAFKDVQRSSKFYKEAQRCSKMLKGFELAEPCVWNLCSKLYKKAQRCSKMLKGFELADPCVWNLCSKLFKDVKDVQRSSKKRKELLWTSLSIFAHFWAPLIFFEQLWTTRNSNFEHLWAFESSMLIWSLLARIT